ncbi:MAG: hypothetical protein QM784_05345 [Polyangiaceae bacterium]
MDVLGLDYYFDDDARPLVSALEWIVALAEQKGKYAALTEFGMRGSLARARTENVNWFTKSFLEPFRTSNGATKIVYALAWRNESEKHFFVPYPSHPMAPDFRRFCSDPLVFMADDLGEGAQLP